MEECKRKMYSEMKFQMEYTHNGHDQWQYTVYMPGGGSKTFSYTLGQEFDSQTLDGRPIVVSKVGLIDYTLFQLLVHCKWSSIGQVRLHPAE